MALVAYDNSDSSDYEDEDNENAAVATIIQKPAVPLPPAPDSATTKIHQPEDLNSASEPSLFNLLPQPSTMKPAVAEEDDEFLHKKETAADVTRPKAKITVPSLSDFKDVDSPLPVARPKPSNGKKSGLLGLLPQPKNGVTMSSTSLIPNVLKQNPTNSNVKKKEPLPSPVKKPKVDPKPLVTSYSDDSDNEDEVQNDFFSINKPVEILTEVPDIPLQADQPKEVPVTKEFKLESYFKKNPVVNHVAVEPETVESFGEYAHEYASSEAGSSSTNAHDNGSSNGELVLDDEAILKLCGARGKRKREDIQIVDVNQQDVLADAREWLLKGLMNDTSKRVSSSKRKGNEPTSQQRRKHQITYLAHQAKANEAELQDQWANSRMSRRQTQNKYGF